MNGIQSINIVRGTALSTNKCLKSLRFRNRNRWFGAQTTVEFALIALPLFVILFATVDYAQIYFYENSLQSAMREAARFTTAGRIIQATNSDGSPAYETNNGVVQPKAVNNGGSEASRYACTRWWFLSNCVIVIPLSNIVVTSAPTLPGVPPTTTTNDVGRLTLLSASGGTPNEGPGGANDYVQITATYTIGTITPGIGYLGGYGHGGWNTYNVDVTTIVKNEPALLNFLHPATNIADPLP